MGKRKETKKVKVLFQSTQFNTEEREEEKEEGIGL